MYTLMICGKNRKQPGVDSLGVKGDAVKEFAEVLVRAIIDREEDLRVNVIESGATIIIEVRVAREDMGKVIGREGNMAWALRTIISNAAAKLKKRALLQILE